jgi:C1A family cysteine protease
MMNFMPRKYELISDLQDERDFAFATPEADLPEKIDLRPQCPPVLEQLSIGSCTAIAIANCYKFLLLRENLPIFSPSRLFIYYNQRVLQGTIDRDSGALIRNGFKTIVRHGVCDENLWRYDISKFKVQPPDICYQAALQHRAIEYQRISPGLSQMKACLAEVFPIVGGFIMYQSFESKEVARTGILDLPKSNEQRLGGHAVLIIGYDSETERFIVMNSWGTTWGQAGYFTIPFAYLLDEKLATDFWTMRKPIKKGGITG